MSRAPVRSKKVALVGALVLVTLAFVTYYPGFRMGFYLDDYNYLERAGRTDWSDALVQIFDPRLQTMWYRPLQAVQFFLEYQLFGANANLYHLVNIAYHAVNTLLLGALVARISKRWLVGFVAAFFYATFPVYASGINWIGIVDPLAALFYLLSVWFWWIYLETQNRRYYVLAFAAFVLALFSKQISVTIPLVLFLAQWWLARERPSLRQIILRYGPFLAGALVFTVVQYLTQSTHTFAGVFGWQFGATMLFILVQYLVLFFFPYGVFPSIDMNVVEVGDALTYAWVGVATLLLLMVAWRRRSLVLAFLGVFTLITLAPVLPFPFIEHRYLYIPIFSAAVILTLVFSRAMDLLGNNLWFKLGSAAALGLLVLGNGLAVNASALDAAEWARQLRVPFRDIERQHASYPQDTLLYFVDPITPTTGGLGGMFFMRYGRGVTVKNWTDHAGLNNHNASYIYYFDEARRPRELIAQKGVTTQSSATLPVDFQVPIRLEGYEVSGTMLLAGEPLALVLYWRAMGKIDRPYTVFVHLVDASGRLVAGYDSQPRKGQVPTNTWDPLLPYTETIIMPLSANVPSGDEYRLQVGLYYLPTQERLALMDGQGRSIGDSITIGTFRVVPPARSTQ